MRDSLGFHLFGAALVVVGAVGVPESLSLVGLGVMVLGLLFILCGLLLDVLRAAG